MLKLYTWVVSLGILAPPLIGACVAAESPLTATWVALTLLAALSGLAVLRLVPAELPKGTPGFVLPMFLVLGLLAGLRTAGTSTFMTDHADQRFALAGPGGFFLEHNCFTCLPVGAHHARHGTPRLYDKSHYRDAKGASRTPLHEEIGDAVSIDPLPYPPPSLLISQVMAAHGHGFFAQRAFWHCLCAGALFLALIGLAGFGRGFGSRPGLLCFPLVLLAPNLIGALQIGNVQTLVVTFAILGMLCFAKRLHGLGGLLLGYAILTKIWPAILLGYLLLGKRYREVWSTLGAMVLLCLATLAAFGTQPFIDFFRDQFWLLENGRAFEFMRGPKPMLQNISIFAWPAKLHVLGVGEAHSLLPGGLKWGYTGFLLLVTLLAGLLLARHDRVRPLQAARTWLALIVLAELRSPFLPSGYGVLPALILVVLLIPGGGPLRAIPLLLAFVVLALNFPFVAGPEPARFDLWWSLGVSAVAFLTAVLALLLALFHRQREAGSDQEEETGGDEPGAAPATPSLQG